MFARYLRKVLHAQKFYRWSSTKFGYQCSKHGSLSSTNAYLESSLRNGASFVVTEPRNFGGVNEHMIELQELDDFKLSDIAICYRSESLRQALDDMDVLKSFQNTAGRAYDYITLPVDELISGESFHSDIKNIRGTTAKPLGLDVRYNTIASTAADQLIQRIDRAAAALGNNVGVLLVEANPWTAASCPALIAWANKRSIPIVAVDTLRADAKSGSPGSLVDPCVRRTGLPPSSSELSSVMEDLKRNINACIHAEMQFMERKLHQSASVAPESLCLGHTLQAVQSSIRFDEEWTYVMQSKLDPEFEASISKLKKCSEQHKNFVTLYVPLRNKLNEAYRHVLLVQLRLLCENAMSGVVLIDNPICTSQRTCYLHECIMKTLAALNFDTVCGSNFEIPATEWEADLAKLPTTQNDTAWKLNVLSSISSGIYKM